MKRAALVLALIAGAAAAHDGVTHKSAADAARHLAGAASAPADDGDASPFPIRLGGGFALTDQTGAERTEADPDGRLQLFFFGYANCQAICSVALPRMAKMTDLAAEAGIAVRPVLITVDPARDTPAAMREALSVLHPEMVGLTGDEASLASVRQLFQIERKLVFEDPEYGPVYAHGSQIYLMDREGGFLTFIPPILSPDRGAEIIAKYAAAI